MPVSVDLLSVDNEDCNVRQKLIRSGEEVSYGRASASVSMRFDKIRDFARGGSFASDEMCKALACINHFVSCTPSSHRSRARSPKMRCEDTGWRRLPRQRRRWHASLAGKLTNRVEISSSIRLASRATIRSCSKSRTKIGRLRVAQARHSALRGVRHGPAGWLAKVW